MKTLVKQCLALCALFSTCAAIPCIIEVTNDTKVTVLLVDKMQATLLQPGHPIEFGSKDHMAHFKLFIGSGNNQFKCGYHVQQTTCSATKEGVKISIANITGHATANPDLKLFSITPCSAHSKTTAKTSHSPHKPHTNQSSQ